MSTQARSTSAYVGFDSSVFDRSVVGVEGTLPLDEGLLEGDHPVVGVAEPVDAAGPDVLDDRAARGTDRRCRPGPASPGAGRRRSVVVRLIGCTTPFSHVLRGDGEDHRGRELPGADVVVPALDRVQLALDARRRVCRCVVGSRGGRARSGDARRRRGRAADRRRSPRLRRGRREGWHRIGRRSRSTRGRVGRLAAFDQLRFDVACGGVLPGRRSPARPAAREAVRCCVVPCLRELRRRARGGTGCRSARSRACSSSSSARCSPTAWRRASRVPARKTSSWRRRPALPDENEAGDRDGEGLVEVRGRPWRSLVPVSVATPQRRPEPASGALEQRAAEVHVDDVGVLDEDLRVESDRLEVGRVEPGVEPAGDRLPGRCRATAAGRPGRRCGRSRPRSIGGSWFELERGLDDALQVGRAAGGACRGCRRAPARAGSARR